MTQSLAFLRMTACLLVIVLLAEPGSSYVLQSHPSGVPRTGIFETQALSVRMQLMLHHFTYRGRAREFMTCAAVAIPSAPESEFVLNSNTLDPGWFGITMVFLFVLLQFSLFSGSSGEKDEDERLIIDYLDFASEAHTELLESEGRRAVARKWLVNHPSLRDQRRLYRFRKSVERYRAGIIPPMKIRIEERSIHGWISTDDAAILGLAIDQALWPDVDANGVQKHPDLFPGLQFTQEAGHTLIPSLFRGGTEQGERPNLLMARGVFPADTPDAAWLFPRRITANIVLIDRVDRHQAIHASLMFSLLEPPRGPEESGAYTALYVPEGIVLENILAELESQQGNPEGVVKAWVREHADVMGYEWLEGIKMRILTSALSEKARVLWRQIEKELARVDSADDIGGSGPFKSLITIIVIGSLLAASQMFSSRAPSPANPIPPIAA